MPPTMGIIGTVMGLVHMLSHLSTPDKLGPSIAMAFLATLYGVSSANLLWYPIAAKLKNKDAKERLYQEMILEGIMALQAGKNPTPIKSTLVAFLPPKSKKRSKRRPRHKEGQPVPRHLPRESKENRDRWLITYADMITLLMVFFIVMYAISTINAQKLAALASSLSQALVGSPPQGIFDPHGAGILSPEGGGQGEELSQVEA